MRSVLPLLLLCLLVTPARGNDDGKWPFGGGSGPRSRGLDLYNLGVLGAKASDADSAPVQPTPQGGGRVSGQVQKGGDEEPSLSLAISQVAGEVVAGEVTHVTIAAGSTTGPPLVVSLEGAAQAVLLIEDDSRAPVFHGNVASGVGLRIPEGAYAWTAHPVDRGAGVTGPRAEISRMGTVVVGNRGDAEIRIVFDR